MTKAPNETSEHILGQFEAIKPIAKVLGFFSKDIGSAMQFVLHEDTKRADLSSQLTLCLHANKLAGFKARRLFGVLNCRLPPTPRTFDTVREKANQPARSIDFQLRKRLVQI